MEHIALFETILYVNDQEKSASFYEKIFRRSPSLHVPGMTEFQIAANIKLGLMPSSGIVKILDGKIEHPDKAGSVARCELYLYVADVDLEFQNAIAAGARILSEVQPRNWGDKACYFADPDGHIIAFAQRHDL
ncbi:MAG: VOC family protein [Chitinophagales bacterium]